MSHFILGMKSKTQKMNLFKKKKAISILLQQNRLIGCRIKNKLNIYRKSFLIKFLFRKK
jgi:hypothetical protein